MGYVRLPPEDRARRAAAVLAAYADGEKIEAIAAAHGLSTTRVCSLARAAGMPKRGRKKMLLTSQQRIEAIVADIAAGHTLRSISNRRRVAMRTIYRIREEHGLGEARVYGQVAPAVLAAITSDPATVAEICARTGLSRPSAQRACYRLQVAGKAINIARQLPARYGAGSTPLAVWALASKSTGFEARP